MLHEDITQRILNAAIKVHSALGAGMLEGAYHACLQYQFIADGLQFEHQVRLPVIYQGVRLDAGYSTEHGKDLPSVSSASSVVDSLDEPDASMKER